MDTPDNNQIEAYLHRILKEGISNSNNSIEPTLLAPEDEAYLKELIKAIRAGQKSVIIIEENDARLKYMFSNNTRAEAVIMMGKVLEATGRRLHDEEGS